VQADDAADCLPIFRLLDSAQNEGRELIAIAMVSWDRHQILAHRADRTYYGSLDDESATARTTNCARTARGLSNHLIDRQTEVFGIIGKPVGHSLSRESTTRFRSG